MARPEILNQHGKHIIDDLNMVHVYKCVSNGRNDVMAHQRVLISCCLLTQWEDSPRRHQHRTRPGLNLRSVNMETWDGAHYSLFMNPISFCVVLLCLILDISSFNQDLTRRHAETGEDPIGGNLNLRILVRILMPALNHKSVPSHGEIGSVFVQTTALDELLSVSAPSPPYRYSRY